MSTNPAGTVGKLTAWKTTPSKLVVREGFNARKAMGDLDSLSQSIIDNGMERALNVIRGEGDTFYVIDGHRRAAALELAVAAKKIDATTFPVPILIAERGLSDLEQYAMMARANDGKPLTPLEEADLFKRMLDAGMSKKDLCKSVGHADLYVQQHLDLLNADPAVHQALSDGSITKTLALNISSQARRNKLSASELVAKATSGKAGAKEAAGLADPYIARQRAIRVKLDTIKETLSEKRAKLNADLVEAGVTRAQLRDAKHYALIRAIGEEAGLRRLVADNTPDEE